MKRKLLAVLLLTALVVGGASAQLMFGVSGAIPTSENLKVKDVVAQFKDGNGIFYGAFAELAFRKLGFGVSINTMTYPDPYYAMNWQIMDGDFYLSYHIIKARAFLDPFAELGLGMMATSNDATYSGSYSGYSSTATFADASYYWYAAAGLGVNLGIVGVFAKFAWNFTVKEPVTYTDALGVEQNYPVFGSALMWGGIPDYRITAGVKLIL